MQSIDLIRHNLATSAARVLAHVEDMRAHGMVPPTPRGGGHTLWVLGHLAYIERRIVHRFLRDEPSPLAAWASTFDGDDVSADPADFPPFDDVLAACRAAREATVALAGSLTEDDLDRRAAQPPAGHDDTFGTYRLCLQFLSDHWYMHRGQLAAARRAAGVGRMWV